MSALGHKQTFAVQNGMSALPSNLLQNFVAFNNGGSGVLFGRPFVLRYRPLWY
jgi:hypothetical protein